MARLVMKFGGTSVATVERIKNAARHVKREFDAGHEIAVVVSAMSGKTNELVAWCKEAAPMFDQAEYDTVVASGEQVTSGLMAIVLQEMGLPARVVDFEEPLVLDRACSMASMRCRAFQTGEASSSFSVPVK